MPPFQGSITALITPFKNGEVDSKAFQRLVDWQIDQGTHGLVPVGTTGESPTLSHEEHKRVVELCIEAAGRRIPVIAGTGSNCTSEAVTLTRHAKEAGWSRPTTTSRPRRAFTSILRRSTTRPTFPSSSTTFPAAASSTCRSR